MKLRVQTRFEIRQIQQTLGITAVYVTHDQEEAISIADRIVVMNEGKIVQVGTPKEIYNTPDNIFVADFIGNTNFIEARVIKVTEKKMVVSLLGEQIDIPYQEKYKIFETNEEVYLTIKPEAIAITDNTPFFGKVSKASFLGHNIQYEVELGNSFVTITAPNNAPQKNLIEEGTIVSLDLPINCIQIIKRDK